MADIGEKVQSHLAAKYVAREEALPLSRSTIRHCANAIRALHRSQFDEARTLLEIAQSQLRAIREALVNHPDIYYGGFVHDAQKEYAEAVTTLAVILGDPLPDPDALGISYAAYLNGLGETVGELRRYLLDSLRHGDISRCEEVMRAMDDIYGLLVTLDYPDAITGGLRRTTDV
ncbi:MAG: haloacid dehalogenase, partial [Chloroflexi bacterium]|nr:haloacid dehalogenase [Chloroflexota bacterium]